MIHGEMPPAVAVLPRNKAGYPIPWFVDRDCDQDGQPDFRFADSRKMADAIRFAKCWVCGQRRGRYGSFVIGPMCAINRTSAEPPAHLDCAVYSATSCPFLATPKMRRRDVANRVDVDKVAPAGVMLLRNPGVTLVWTSTTFHPFQVGNTFHPFQVGNGVLFDIGNPVDALWFCQGRTAQPAEILASIDSGLPALTDIAEQEGPRAVRELRSRYDDVVTRWAT